MATCQLFLSEKKINLVIYPVFEKTNMLRKSPNNEVVLCSKLNMNASRS